MKNKMSLLSMLATLITMLIGVLVFVGWLTHNDFLRAIVPGQVKLKFNAALGFIFCGIVVLLHFYPRNQKISKPVSIGLSVLIFLIGLLTLIEYVFKVDFGIDELFFRDETRTSTFYFAGRMSPLVALNFLLIGIGLPLMNKARFAVFQFLYLISVGFVSFLMLIGFNFIADIPAFIRIAILGAVGFISLSVALYAAQPMLQSKITFELRMATGFIASLILVVIISVLSAYYSSKRVEMYRAITSTNTFLYETALVLSTVKDIEIGARGYLAKPDSLYPDYLRNAQKNVLIQIKELKELRKPGPVQSAELDSLEVLLNEQMRLATPAFGQIRKLITDLQMYEIELLHRQQKEYSEDVASFNRAFSIFLATVFLLLLVILFYIRNNIAHRRKSEASLSKQNVELGDMVLDRKKALEVSEKLYGGLFENMMHGFIYCQVLYDKQHVAEDYVYLVANSAYESATGLKDLVGRKISDIIPGLNEQDPVLFATIGRVSTSGKSEKFETFVLALNRWYSVSMYCPEIGYFVALVDNITESKDAESRLLESERRFRSLIENSSDAIVLTDKHLNVLYQSPSSERITGFTSQEGFLNRGLDYVHDDDVEKTEKMFTELSHHPGSTIPFQNRFLHKKGHYIWIDGLITNLLDEPHVNAFVVNYRDVTGRKEMEEQQALLTSIVSSSEDAIVSKTLEGVITSWNLGAQKLFGYSADEVIGRNISILIPPDRLNEEPLIIKKIQLGELVNHFETKRIKKGGDVVHISLTISPILNKKGVIIGASKIARDISERRLAAQKLAASEQRFRALIENSSDAIVLNDKNSRIIYQSPSVSRILGYSLQERIGKPVQDYVHPNDYESLVDLHKNLKRNAGRPLSFQYRFKRKNGDFIWLEGVVTNLLDDPNVNAIVANYRDITARKEADEALELTIDRFKQAQQIAHLGHWEVDFATKKSSWSDEAFRIFGIEPDTIQASQELFLSTIEPDDLEWVKSTMDHSAQNLEPFSIRHRIRLGDGSTRTLLSVGRYEFDKSKKPLRLYGISLDVTELREKEKKLEEANKDLETFIYKSSHDLRSPIASLLGLINVARADITDVKALSYLDMVNEVVLRQNKMLLNLIDVMAIRNQKVIARSFEIEPLVTEVLLSLESMEGFNKVKFSVNLKMDKPMQTDRKLLKTALLQLIENSILYASEHGAETHIQIACDEQDNILLEVADNGTGIPNESLDKIFDMFYRASFLSKGSGLGLYLAKTAVERMGGRITVSSEERKGSTFFIRLPIEFPSDSLLY
jgi:PAS domain S-box-containing protein